MKKFLPLLILLFVLAVTPVFAQSYNSNPNSYKGKNNIIVNDPSPTPQATCDPALDYKNHGAYVSCVARLHQGGQTTSNAAKSDVGKKSGSVNQVASGSASPSPTASASASPLSTASAQIEATKTEIKSLINILKDLLKSLRHLFG